MKPIRMDKYLADMGIGTRSEIKKYIKKNLVSLNGEIITRPEIKVTPEQDEIKFNNEKIKYEEFVYYMLNKPAGYISATKDDNHKTVIELIDASCVREIFPVGRLDIDTEGLLLLTNDGELAHDLLAPGKHVDKTYFAKVKGVVEENLCDKFRNGLDIGEKKMTLPAKLDIIKSSIISEVEITICEGKFHQIKRMFESVGMKVLYLKRLRMGRLKLDEDLEIGKYRLLTEEEVVLLKGKKYNA